jgi:general nucleoside transport system permease protein
MALGGMLAGLAGIFETAAIQGRLQANLSAGAGLSGFLVAWLARNHCLRIIPMSLLVGALLASGDGVQMFANLPSSIALVVQGLLFVAVLLVGGLASRIEARRG